MKPCRLLLFALLAAIAAFGCKKKALASALSIHEPGRLSCTTPPAPRARPMWW